MRNKNTPKNVFLNQKYILILETGKNNSNLEQKKKMNFNTALSFIKHYLCNNNCKYDAFLSYFLKIIDFFLLILI